MTFMSQNSGHAQVLYCKVSAKHVFFDQRKKIDHNQKYVFI